MDPRVQRLDDRDLRRRGGVAVGILGGGGMPGSARGDRHSAHRTSAAGGRPRARNLPVPRSRGNATARLRPDRGGGCPRRAATSATSSRSSCEPGSSEGSRADIGLSAVASELVERAVEVRCWTDDEWRQVVTEDDAWADDEHRSERARRLVGRRPDDRIHLVLEAVQRDLARAAGGRERLESRRSDRGGGLDRDARARDPALPAPGRGRGRGRMLGDTNVSRPSPSDSG